MGQKADVSIQTPTHNVINQPTFTVRGEEEAFSGNNSAHPDEDI